MNKKETAYVEQLQHELRLAKAFTWTQPVAPDVPAPANGKPDTVGYDFNTHISQVRPATSTTVSHYSGAHKMPSFGYGSKGAIPLYSTKLLALRALRHGVELECAKRLAAIDQQIEVEQADAATPAPSATAAAGE